ncbi:hypothetical protein AB833_13830 [Chromatiales bacterium (ex Bugula neritina AB1)]|nr:hypothetical protein AB833_13830 [Chromatiales bacterium (ex Bugula neritina AB1)]
MRVNSDAGKVMRFILALESRVNAFCELLGKKYPEESDIDERSVGRKETTEHVHEEEDDVFGHRTWIFDNDDVAIGNQMFEENK